MVDGARGYLSRQFETARKLTNFHLDGLATEECLRHRTKRSRVES
jgi:hypothetical protein